MSEPEAPAALAHRILVFDADPLRALDLELLLMQHFGARARINTYYTATEALNAAPSSDLLLVDADLAPPHSALGAALQQTWGACVWMCDPPAPHGSALEWIERPVSRGAILRIAQLLEPKPPP